MGLCKCPKKKVTNLFCYEHRVNVCQHCMVTNHPKCIVQSYIHWLQDTDYNPICTLCNKGLATDDCIRLLCYHVFHWPCLDQYARQLPETTAPAGYSCPACKEPFFPKLHVVSPVADAWREKIASVNWARVGLGLPLLSEDGEVKRLSNENVVGVDKIFPSSSNSTSCSSDIVVHMEDSSSTFSRMDLAVQIPRRTGHGIETEKAPLLDDDDNKYRRRSPADWLNRWSKLFSTKLRLVRGPRRSCILFLITLVAMGFIIMIFSTLGRIAAADDPSLNLEKHPHIHVNNAN